MSYYLIDFSSKTNDFNFDNLIIGKKIKIDQDNAKYYIYYKDVQSDTPKEIYIRLPIIRLIYLMGNHKYNQISLPIYPNWDGTTKFINFIKKLEQDIEGCFNKKKINKEWSSLINKKNLLNLIKTNINNNIKITSNIENKNIKLTDFKINGQIDMVIKLSYIWSNSKKIGLSSHVYQIKYLAPPEQLNINFIDQEVPINPLNLVISSHSLLDFKKNQNNLLTTKSTVSEYNSKISTELPSQIKLNIIPTLSDLQNAIKSLKKPLINKND
jgi:hypothetical protein